MFRGLVCWCEGDLSKLDLPKELCKEPFPFSSGEVLVLEQQKELRNHMDILNKQPKCSVLCWAHAISRTSHQNVFNIQRIHTQISWTACGSTKCLPGVIEIMQMAFNETVQWILVTWMPTEYVMYFTKCPGGHKYLHNKWYFTTWAGFVFLCCMLLVSSRSDCVQKFQQLHFVCSNRCSVSSEKTGTELFFSTWQSHKIFTSYLQTSTSCTQLTGWNTFIWGYCVTKVHLILMGTHSIWFA